MRRTWLRLWTFLRRDRAERELARELASHLGLLEDDLRRRGWSEADARAGALRALGGEDRARELHRDARSIGWLEDLRHDLGYGWRTITSARVLSTAIVLTLGVGIGATTAIFAVADTLLLKPLPYAADPSRLVRLVAITPASGATGAPPRRQDVGVTAEEADILSRRLRTMRGVGMAGATIMNIRGVEGAGAVSVSALSAETWRLLDARAASGRIVSPGADGAHEIVLSHAAWQRWFSGAPDVLGRTVTLDTVLGRRVSRVFTVVGIMPDHFSFPRPDTLAWTAPPAVIAGDRVVYRGRMLARLADGVSPETALAEIAPVVRALRQHPPEVQYSLVREQDELVAPVRPATLVLVATVGTLLLIACLNVTNLLLARTLSRRRELSMRVALGASRGRLARQALTESTLLGVAGGVAGIVVAAAALALFRHLATTLPRLDLASSGPGWGGASFPRLDEIAVDGRVLAFTLGLSICCGAAVGLAAAMRAARADVFSAFRAATGTGTVTSLTRHALVVVQVAAATTLLIGALVLSGSLSRLLAVETGYTTRHVTTFQVALPAGAYTDARQADFAAALQTRVRAVPGVASVGYANQTPMVQLRDSAGGLWTTPDAARTFVPDAADARFVSQGYLRTLGVRLVAGRGFDERDDAAAPRVVLVNEALVRRQFSDRAPIGEQVYVGRDVHPWTIIGIVADVRQFGLESAAEPQFFLDLRQWNGGMPLFPAGPYFVVNGPLSPAALSAALAPLVRALDGDATLFNVTPLADIVASSVARPRLYATLVSAFAAMGVFLAAVGLYGVLAYVVQSRTGELGVRMALGATRTNVVGMVMRQGGGLVLAGLVLGLAGGLALTRGAATLLYGVQPGAPGVYLLATAVFALVGSMATVLPAWRAARVDPLTAIRRE